MMDEETEETYPLFSRDEGIRAVALQAAGASWAGISALTNRDDSIVRTAKRLEQYLREGE